MSLLKIITESLGLYVKKTRTLMSSRTQDPMDKSVDWIQWLDPKCCEWSCEQKLEELREQSTPVEKKGVPFEIPITWRKRPRRHEYNKDENNSPNNANNVNNNFMASAKYIFNAIVCLQLQIKCIAEQFALKMYFW